MEGFEKAKKVEEPKPRKIVDPELEKLRYRFGGVRYTLQRPNGSLSYDMVPTLSSLYAFPKSDSTEDDE